MNHFNYKMNKDTNGNNDWKPVIIKGEQWEYEISSVGDIRKRKGDKISVYDDG